MLSVVSWQSFGTCRLWPWPALLIVCAGPLGVAGKLTWDFSNLTSWKHTTESWFQRWVSLFLLLCFRPSSSLYTSSDVSSQPRNPSCIKRLKDLSASWAVFFPSEPLLFTLFLHPGLSFSVSSFCSPSLTFSLYLSLSICLSPRAKSADSPGLKIECVYAFVHVCVCGPDKLCWFMNLLPLPVSTNPPSERHTHTHTNTHLARQTAPGGVFRFGDPLYVNFVRETREKTNGKWGSWKCKISEKRSKTEMGGEGEKWNTKFWGERDRARNLVGKRRRREERRKEEESGRAGQERKVWAYLTGQASARSLCRLTEEGGVVTPQNDSEERVSESLKKMAKKFKCLYLPEVDISWKRTQVQTLLQRLDIPGWMLICGL